jgi:hypothetical protein
VSDDLGAKLSRWSQRKAAARRGVPLEEAGGETSDHEVAVAPPAADASGAPASPAAEEAPALPSIEELTAESDYSVFLGDNVPEEIKRAALRKLWRSDPVFGELDGLNDYDEDYNLAGSLVGSVRSAYKAGRGYVEEAEEKLAQAESGTTGDTADDAESRAEAPEQAIEKNNDQAAVDDIDNAADAAAPQVGASEDDDPVGGAV